MSTLHDEQIPSREKVLIVGAGPAGLAAAAALQALEVPFDLVDRAAHVGGIWNPDREDSPVWPALEMVSSRDFTQFEDMIQPASYPSFLDPVRMAKYLRAYAAKHRLTEHFQPRTEVRYARPFGEGTWQVELSNGQVHVYRALIAAHGISQRPHRPAWARELPRTTRVLDARDWTGGDGLEGLRVVVVGSGQSAADIAVDAARRAGWVHWSVRSGHWILPRRIGPVPGDVLASREPALLGRVNARIADLVAERAVGDPADLGLPRPAADVLDDRAIVSDDVADRIREGRITPAADVVGVDEEGRLRLADGSVLAADVVILATGYELGADYLSDDLLPRTASGSPDLFLGAFPRSRDDLVLLGQVRVTGGVLPVLVEQADVAALFLRAVRDDAPAAEAFRRLRSGADASVRRRTVPDQGLLGRLRGALDTASEARRRIPAPDSGVAEGLVPFVDRDELLERLRAARSVLS
ncbi:flavin-containing monooxygenase [Brachybacterium hainanense]|uniref:Flavin-containing monooxygenase n=1 Tax=Brachybacterium hainanense TaxID=1541174 RepID=A0ABV6RDE0_9MICO